MLRALKPLAALTLGLGLAMPLSAAAELQVLQRAPVGDLDSLEAGKEVVITFSHPMVALNAAADMAANCPCQITPALPGRCRWRGTNTLVYEFAQTPGPGRRIQVHVPKGTRSEVGGQTLAADVDFNFNTVRPRFRQAYPGDDSRWLGLHPTFYAQFSLSMTAAEAGRYARLVAADDTEVPLDCKAYSFKALRQAQAKGELSDVHFYRWSGADQVLAFKPLRALKPDTAYALRFRQGWPALGGEAGEGGLAEAAEVKAHTYGAFKILGVEPYSDCSTRARLRLSNPVLVDKLSHYIRVSPAVKIQEDEGGDPEEAYERDGEWKLVLGAWRFKPEVQYHIEVQPGLVDAFGNTLEKTMAFDWTAPKLCADHDFKGGFGVLESYVPPKHPLDVTNQPRVPLRYKALSPDEAVPAYQAYHSAWGEEKTMDGAKYADWPVAVSPNVKMHSFIDLKALMGESLKSYALVGVKEDGKRWTDAFDNLTNLGLTFKASPESALVWTTDLRTGAPAADIAVEIRDPDNKVLWKGRSDSQGLAKAPGWKGLGIKSWKGWDAPELFVLAYGAGSSALLSSHYREGIEPWRFHFAGGSADASPSADQRRWISFTDRGVYRPGESVHFRSYVRELEGGDWRLPAGLGSFALEVRDSRERSQLTATAELKNGALELAFSIPQDAATGTWSIGALKPKAANGEDEGYGRPAGPYQDFRVEAVKAASYQVHLDGLPAWLRLGEPLQAQVAGRYLAGSGMPGAAGDWTLSLLPTAFEPKNWQGWDFRAPRSVLSTDEEEDEDVGEADEEASHRPVMAGSGSFKLDAKSQFALSAPTKGLKDCAPCLAQLEVNLSSPDRQKLFVRGSVMVHGGEAYPGVKAAQDFARVGKPFRVDWVVVDPDGRTLDGRKVSLRLIHASRQNARRVGAFGRLEWLSEEKRETLAKAELKSGARPQAWDFTPKAPGAYQLLLSAEDAQGRKQSAAADFYAYGEGEASWRRDDSDMIELVPDKEEYQPGDTAKILVKSPFDASTALVTVEREGILDAQVRQLGAATALEIPITEGMLPNAYIGVALARGRAAKWAWGPDGEDLAKPTARFGYATLRVAARSRRLTVQPSTDKPDYRPGAKVQAQVKVSDDGGKPVAADLTLYAVDEGILQLTGYQTPDPYDAYYGVRPLWVGTADNRLAVIGIRNFGEKGQDRGGGGDDVMAPGQEGRDLRRRFESLAFWSASLRSGADGLAKAQFQLPDNLTRFRLMAVAAEGPRFGSGEAGFLVNKRLVLRPSLPRFARLGDHFQAGVSVQNASAQAGRVQVELQVPEGLSLTGAAQQGLDLKAGEAREVLWDLRAQGLGPATLRFHAQGDLGGPESDGLEWSFPVREPEKREHAATSGVVDAAPVTEKIGQPGNATAGTAQVQAGVAGTAMLGLQGGMRALIDYPHLCLEQQLSRSLPVLVGRDRLEAFKLGPSAERVAAAQAALDALPQHQDGSGGYRYWTDDWLKPDPWLTAYALEVAALAKEAGFKVPKASIQRAVDWLRQNYDAPDTWAYHYSEEERDVLRAWALYALWRNGSTLPGLYSTLYARRRSLPLFSQADLLRVAKAYGDDAQVKDLAQGLLNQAKVEARSLHFEEPHADRMPWVHASSTAVTGFCLDALLQAQGGFAGDEKAAHWLAESRHQDGAWGDTQSNAWALMGLTRYFRHYEKDEPDFTATLAKADGSVLWNEPVKGRALAAKLKVLDSAQLYAGGDGSVSLSKQGTGRLYYSLDLNWVPAQVDKPAFEGFEIRRQLQSLKGESVSGPLKAGQRYRMHLEVSTAKDRNFVALTDFLPAGLEVVTAGLATESTVDQAAAGSSAATDDPWAGWWGRFQRHEDYDDRVEVFADYLAAGTHKWDYVVQATTPGRFVQPSAWIEMMYEPEVFGRTANGSVEVDAP
jgi:uncharacterized protein YfaS (alpha-2-macroglobulin family)